MTGFALLRVSRTGCGKNNDSQKRVAAEEKRGFEFWALYENQSPLDSEMIT